MKPGLVCRVSLAIVACAVMLACGDAAAPGPPDVNGSWTLSMSDLAGPHDINCSAAGTTLHFASAGANFTGTYSGGEYTCTDSTGQTLTAPVGSGQVLNGRVAGKLVVFDLGSAGNGFTGQVSGGTMSGTVSIAVGVADGIVVSGNWQTVRPGS